MLTPLLFLLLFLTLADTRLFLPLGRPLLHCHWEGSGPICFGHCPFDSFEILRSGEANGQGDNFGHACYFGMKSLCCPRSKRLY
ncbi:hypothetical protein PRIPAC_72272 [Pristionchus pacificus]|uniref:Uncharacterized protein n=1 Tax=Pristionchus pacificus TaxID=54126 RepID=A0A2A6C7J5_PRIPA|nr:hypothetical protein PRIPAC_72272 [Pristionchus pacificus]|eukprot:PDM74023.1 hypothetical protein PRIPAC_41379 [Pristionchus pacificus]